MVVDRNDELGQVLVRVAKVRFDHLGGPGDAFFAFSTYNGRYTPTEERTSWIIIRPNRSGSIPIS